MLLLTIIILLFQGCLFVPVYTSNKIPIHLFNNDKQIQASVNTIFNRRYENDSYKSIIFMEAIEGKFAYSFANNYIIYTSLNYQESQGNHASENFDEYFYFKHKYIEGGLGKFWNKKFGNNYGTIEFLMGYGNGFTKSHDESYEPLLYSPSYVHEQLKLESYYHKYFAQINCGYSSKIIDGGLGLRFSRIVIDELNIIKQENCKAPENKLGYFLEPAFMLRSGSEKIKLETQLGFSLDLNKVDFEILPWYLSLGLFFKY